MRIGVLAERSGVPAKTIRYYEVPCEYVTELIGRRAAEIDERISELQQTRKDLRKLALRARSLDPKDCQPSNVCHIIALEGR